MLSFPWVAFIHRFDCICSPCNCCLDRGSSKYVIEFYILVISCPVTYKYLHTEYRNKGSSTVNLHMFKKNIYYFNICNLNEKLTVTKFDNSIWLHLVMLRQNKTVLKCVRMRQKYADANMTQSWSCSGQSLDVLGSYLVSLSNMSKILYSQTLSSSLMKIGWKKRNN